MTESAHLVERADSIPFCRLLGQHAALLGVGRAVVGLPEKEELGNTVGSVHALAVPVPAETAAGLALMSALTDFPGFVPLAREMTVRYHRPARGPLRVTVELDDEMVADLRARLEADGRADVVVDTEVCDGSGEPAATVSISWAVRKIRPAGDSVDSAGQGTTS